MADKVVKGIGAMIGLATEAHAEHKMHKAQQRAKISGHRDGEDDEQTTVYEASIERDGYDKKDQDVHHSAASSSRPIHSKQSSSSFTIPMSPATSQEIAKELPKLEAENNSPSFSGLEGEIHEKDEADWEIDDAIAEHEHEAERESFTNKGSMEPLSEDDFGPVPSNTEGKQYYVDRIVSAFLAKHPLPRDFDFSPLPSAVIVPQRRPHSKRRGFVRAYAPILENAGINQDTFLHFLKSMQQSARASPYFRIINIAAMVIGCVPSIACMVASALINVAVMAAMEVQENQRNNDFLTQMNDKFFRPRGLYCLIFAYKPEEHAHSTQIDISATIFDKMKTSSNKIGQTFHNASRASGKTHGEVEMPEAAPLIFPALDQIEDTTHQSKMKRRGKFVANYFDKRAQAAYMTENPNSTLANLNTQEHHFASRYADPNHPVNSGSPISLLTGGYINPGPPGMRRGLGNYGVGIGGGRQGMLGGGGARGFGGRGYDGWGRGFGHGPLGGRSGFGGVGDLIVGVAGLIKDKKSGKAQEHQDGDRQLYHQNGEHDGYHHHHEENNSRELPGGREGETKMGGVDGDSFGDRQDMMYEQNVAQVGTMGSSGRMGRYDQGLTSYGQHVNAPALVRRLLTPNVLYLMVVNMPTEEELATARKILEKGSMN